ncbi:UDP-glucose 4-epimerase GalE [Rhodobacter ferrooxidans]|uniref:UDP-glucose 4-epimerase n=1 Tax=Rhodobacter ferrooxidans TaxID=371731 RepID=C8RY46_9RHOB|nr:UDP-glucose 4-epimerase GalE [Rhodobacter sp. SW2]EEW26444.1 UDP-glucose 4-epimerase [Rhodobacter sp. SW2]
MTGDLTVLVTGGAGYIGSHACKALRRAGFTPVAFDNLCNGHRDAVRFGPFVHGDVRDGMAVQQALRDHGAVAVMHFAAFAYVGESMQKPQLYYDNNVGGMLGLLAGCRGAGVNRVVLSSSCATYGQPAVMPITEATPQQPINPYGQTKLICEHMLRDIGAASDLTHVALRYFNAAGADPDGELTERHDPETHLIPLALLAAAGRRGALGIFGTDYPTPDGTCVRDYIHVSDLARAHVLALRHLLAGRGSVALNLGTGQGTSVRQIVAAVENVTGRRVPVQDLPRRPGDPPILLADPGKAAQVLDFRPDHSDITSMVRHAAPSFGLEVANDQGA